MTEIKRGDKVRITYEGTVRSHGPGVIDLDQYFAPFYTTGGATVEVLERARPKVGDVLTGPELADLPVGSLVRYQPGGGIRFRTASGWAYDHESPVRPPMRQRVYEVLYNPAAA